MTDEEIVNAKRALSTARVLRFGPMPPDGAEGKALWLSQMDQCAAALGEPNVYRTYGMYPKPQRRRHVEVRRDRFADE